MKNILIITGVRIEFKSQLEHITDIKERNKVFNKLGKVQQRKEIAWDCLTLVLHKQIKASNGCYWNDKLMENLNIEPAITQTNLLNTEKLVGCEVCAKGGLMLSRIRLGNQLGLDKFTKSSIAAGTSTTNKAFTPSNFDLIEQFYERSGGIVYWKNKDYRLSSHPYLNNSNERLANILCNIIVNGFFNPADTTDYIIINDAQFTVDTSEQPAWHLNEIEHTYDMLPVTILYTDGYNGIIVRDINGQEYRVSIEQLKPII